MTSIASLRMEIQTGDVTRASRELDKMTKAGGRAERSARGVETASRAMGAAMAAAVASLGVGQLIALSDQYTSFTAQLRLATRGQAEFAKANADVRRISNLAQSGIAETGVLYARVASSAREAGLSQQKASDITEAVSLALKVSGASAAEAGSAMLQFSQAMAAGALRGEEFNSVNEAAPRLMRALAEGIGVPVGALRDMAAQGQITTQVIANALPQALGQLRDEASQVQTISGSFQLLRNELMQFVGQSAQASGAAQALASGIGLVANNLNTITAVAGGFVAAKLATVLLEVSAASASSARAFVAQAQAAAAAHAAEVASTQSTIARTAAEAAGLKTTLATVEAARAQTVAELARTNVSVASARATIAATSAMGAHSAALLANAAATRALAAAEAQRTSIVSALAVLGQQQASLSAKITAATAAQTAAQAALNTATSAGISAAGLATRALGFLGGPIGAVATALGIGVTAWMTWGRTGRQESGDLASKIETDTRTVTQKLDEQIEKLRLRNQLIAAAGEALAGTSAANKAAEYLDTATKIAQGQLFPEITDLASRAAMAEAYMRKYNAAIAEGNQELTKQAEILKRNQSASRSKFMEDYATSVEKAAAEIAKWKKELGDAFTPEMEKRIRDKFINPTKSAAEALKELRNEQKALDDVVKEALDRDKVLVDLEKERQDIEGRGAAQRAQQLVNAADMLRAIEFETQALQMSNVEREISVAMLKLEEQGIVAGTAAYEHYAEAIRGAIVNRDAVQRSVEQTKEIQREYEQMSDQIGQSLSDALMQGGKSAADYLKGLFRNLVLQPLLRPVGNAIAGAVTGFAPVAASAASGGSALGSLGALSGLTGAAGTFGSSFRYGLGALTGERSLTGLLGMGSDLFAGGLVDGLGTLAGALGPIALGAMAISKLFSGGETRSGGRYGMVGGQASYLEGPSGGEVGPMAEAVQSAIDSINATLTAVGSQAAVTGFAAGVETSKNRRGGAFAGGALSTGATFGDTTDAVGWRYSENLDASDAGARFARELQMATIEALQAADLGGVIGRMVEGVDFSSMSDDALAGLSAQIQQTIASVTAFRESIAGLPMANLAGLSFDAAAALVEFSGGLESLQNNLGAYYQQFFSEEERVAALTGQLTAQLAALGFAMPETREGFRALVEAQDLTTDAGQRTYAALLDIADGFASVVPATEILTDVIGDVGGTVTDVAETVEQALARIRAEVRAAEAIARNIIALEQQLYREQNFGDTAALRAQELDGLTAAEQALMRQIWAIQDAREAEARAAEEAARAAREAQTSFTSYAGSARNEWEGLVKSLYDEIRRIRGDLYGGGAMGYAQAQSQFAITSAKARAGDQNAAGMLPELSRTLLTLAEANATTLVELQRIRAQTVGSLQGTADLLGRRYGVPAMATGTNMVPRDMLAMLHEGEAVVPKAYNPAAGGGSERELLAEIRSLNARMARIESQTTATARHTERAAVVLDDASRGKRPLVTEASA